MNKRSPGSFCSLVVATTTGTSDSVTSIDVAAVGNGAECYCVANDAVYRYNAASSQTTVGDTFITPTSGGGCWNKQNAEGDYALSLALAAASFGAVITSSGVWQAFPSAANAYAIGVPSNFFTLNTTTGVITYTGPTNERVLIVATLCIVPGGAVSTTIELDLSVAGGLIGGSSQSPQSVAQSIVATNELMELTQSFMIQLVHNTTYQHVILASGTPANLSFLRYQVQLTNLG